MLDEDEQILTSVQTPVTGDWQNWETVVSHAFQLDKGKQFLTVKSLAKEFNINWMEVSIDSLEAVNAELINSNHKLKVFPNPLHGNSLIIELGQETNFTAVTIFTMEGKLEYQDSFHGPRQSLVVEGLSLERGVYIVRIDLGDSKHFVKLLSQ